MKFLQAFVNQIGTQSMFYTFSLRSKLDWVNWFGIGFGIGVHFFTVLLWPKKPQLPKFKE